MLLKDFLTKVKGDWDRDRGLKVEVVNRLRRLGYSLADSITSDDEPVVSGILKKASRKWKSSKQIANSIHVAYPISVSLPSARPRCPNCTTFMRIALLCNDIETNYCPNCKICKVPE